MLPVLQSKPYSELITYLLGFFEHGASQPVCVYCTDIGNRRADRCHFLGYSAGHL